MDFNSFNNAGGFDEIIEFELAGSQKETWQKEMDLSNNVMQYQQLFVFFIIKKTHLLKYN